MKKAWKTLFIGMCISLTALLPIRVYADITPEDAPIEAGERADSDGDADLPSFWQDGMNACGIDENQTLQPSTIKVADVIEVMRPIIYVNEVGKNWTSNYGFVTRNDNGYGISAGILQWNGTNALKLLKSIVEKDGAAAQETLGTDLYNKIITDKSWDGNDNKTRFIPTEEEALAIGTLLSGDNGKAVQDATADLYLNEYITLGYSTYKLRNAAALSYFCDIRNQCSITTAQRIVTAAIEAAGSAEAVTLNDLHEASVADSVAGKYLSRRFLTYRSIANTFEDKGWDYLGGGSYRIPSATVGSTSTASEVMWLQSALNLILGADLDVDGKYGSKTKAAITEFQTKYQETYSLTVDGYAGQQTIASLIKAIQTGQQPENDGNELAKTVPKLTKSANAATGVTLTWKKVSKAEGYYVYRKSNSGDTFQKVGETASGKLTYTDTTVTSGTTYIYTIRAYNGTGMSSYDTNGTTIVYLEVPVLSKLAQTTKGPKLTWKKVSGAGGYYIYRKSGTGAYSRVGTVTAGSTVTFTDTTAAAGKTYSYTVSAYNKTYESAYDTQGLSIYNLKAPKISKVAVTTSGMKISWNKVTGAKGYYVYRKASGGNYKKIATIKSGSTISYTDKKGTNGKKYTYMVRAYRGKTESANYSGVSKAYVKFAKYKTTANLNYRSGAGTKYTTKGTLKKGKTVYVVPKSAKKANGYTWYKVMIGSKYYYVASKFLKKI